ncbi:MAG TPA: type II secretion system protein [Candidatus Paceibacterota bacterium]|nr:type II secretion system protein [Candidatus Paceibacterota bacterium]
MNKPTNKIPPLRTTNYELRTNAGFTLVEMIVAVALFALVMLVSVGALLSLTAANRKAQALQSVMNNLNVALDGMVRSIRMGTDYHCGGGAFTLPQNCPNGDALLAFEPFGGNPSDSADQWIYSYDPATKRVYKSEKGTTISPFPVTAPEITIDSMKFYVVGTTRGDTTQPKVVITMEGTAGAANVKTRTAFSLQATAVQRVLDL